MEAAAKTWMAATDVPIRRTPPKKTGRTPTKSTPPSLHKSWSLDTTEGRLVLRDKQLPPSHQQLNEIIAALRGGHLLSLELWSVSMRAEDVRALTPLGATLQRLELGGNPSLGDAGACAVASALRGARSPVARRALSAWFGACANVVTPNVRAPTARRPRGSAKIENQPFLEAAVKDALYDLGASCGYGAGGYDVRVLDNALFQAGYVGASPAAVFFHANHRAGWRAKCLALRDAGALYVADCSGDGSPAALGACVAPGARHLADDDVAPRRRKAAGTSLVGLAIMAAELAMLCGLVAAQL